jgi:hypothetical protein
MKVRIVEKFMSPTKNEYRIETKKWYGWSTAVIMPHYPSTHESFYAVYGTFKDARDDLWRVDGSLNRVKVLYEAESI